MCRLDNYSQRVHWHCYHGNLKPHDQMNDHAVNIMEDLFDKL